MELNWVKNFLSFPSSYVFVDVEVAFLKEFLENFTTANSLITDLEEAKNLILTSTEEEVQSAPQPIQFQAEILYGLAHAKYLHTPEGQEKMISKQKNKIFMHCPRLSCERTICFPCGVSDIPQELTIKMYCPNCHEIYNVSDELISKIDGAYFGLNWLESVCQSHPELRLSNQTQEYVPRIYGFRIYQPPEAPLEEKQINE
ncbi:Casein kinase II subunit beta [Histomonas meleagridis]|uniref:Casein kinase II subunit beta n=1 Tax=Histomonas meleagridis TaxID=135588 RepID=UPI00355ABABA|nr:Casein kinase II subunit beta [Histomonas meleagridis]KAH0803482.1 Casein kinase II subunit beta [Histomonas meleagridis]